MPETSVFISQVITWQLFSCKYVLTGPEVRVNTVQFITESCSWLFLSPPSVSAPSVWEVTLNKQFDPLTWPTHTHLVQHDSTSRVLIQFTCSELFMREIKSLQTIFNKPVGACVCVCNHTPLESKIMHFRYEWICIWIFLLLLSAGIICCSVHFSDFVQMWMIKNPSTFIGVTFFHRIWSVHFVCHVPEREVEET